MIDIKNKENIPEGYKLVKGIGVIPEDWNKKCMSDLFQLFGGESLSREKTTYDEGDIYYLHYGDIHTKLNEFIDETIIKKKLPRIVPIYAQKVKKDYAFLKQKDIVFADASEDYDDIGKTVYIKEVGNNKLLSGLHTIIARPKEEISKYFMYVFNIESIKKEIKKMATGISVLGISKSNLLKLKICFPNIVEQKRIAECLMLWDKAIDKQKQLIEQKKEYKKGLMQNLLTGRVRFPEFKKAPTPEKLLSEYDKNNLPEEYKFVKGIGVIPVDFEIFELGKLLKFSSGKTKPENISENKKIGMNPVYGGNGVIGFSCFYNSEVEQIIIGRVGEKCGCIHFSKEKCWVTDNALMIKEEKNKINRIFLKELLNFINLSKYRSKGGQPLITQKGISRIKILFPIEDEQNKIADALTAFDKEIDLEEKKLSDLELQKKGLMQKLLTGKVRFPEFI